jgi:hypothetical protein
LILEEAEKLYNKLTTELTNRAIAAGASIMTSSLPPLINMQKLTHKKNNIYQIEEPRYTIIIRKFITMIKSNQMKNNRILKSNEYQKFHNQSLYKLT